MFRHQLGDLACTVHVYRDLMSIRLASLRGPGPSHAVMTLGSPRLDLAAFLREAFIYQLRAQILPATGYLHQDRPATERHGRRIYRVCTRAEVSRQLLPQGLRSRNLRTL